MIYIFGKGKDISIVYDENYLSEEQKTKAKVFETLPPVKEKPGFRNLLVLENDKLIWEHEEIIEEPEEIEEVQKTKK